MDVVRTQIQLDEPLYEELRRIAHRDHISLAEAVRRLIRRGLEAPARRSPRGAAALLELSGIAAGPGDLGRRHDEYLAEEE